MVSEILRVHDVVGESPSWFEKEKALYWVSIPEGIIHRYDLTADHHDKIQLSNYVSSISPASNGKAVITSANAIYELDYANNETSLLQQVYPLDSENRLNDAKCDITGRLWVGSMNLKKNESTASLFIFSNTGELFKVLNNLTVSNGITWNRNTYEFYHIDTPSQIVSVFKYSDKNNLIQPLRKLDLSSQVGKPDGMTIDKQGYLWISMFGGYSVIRCDPYNGDVVDRIELPTKFVTSCCFGGNNMRTMYITTANKPFGDVISDQRAGSLFAEELSISGEKSHSFKF